MKDKKWAAQSVLGSRVQLLLEVTFCWFFFSNTILADLTEWSIYGKPRLSEVAFLCAPSPGQISYYFEVTFPRPTPHVREVLDPPLLTGGTNLRFCQISQEKTWNREKMTPPPKSANIFIHSLCNFTWKT